MADMALPGEPGEAPMQAASAALANLRAYHAQAVGIEEVGR